MESVLQKQLLVPVFMHDFQKGTFPVHFTVLALAMSWSMQDILLSSLRVGVYSCMCVAVPLMCACC